jgi:NAD+ synthase (glutamine-hydrolysing)
MLHQDPGNYEGLPRAAAESVISLDKSLRVMACAPAFGAPGDIRRNTDAILEQIREAQSKSVQLLVLPELCLSSGSCGDLFLYEVLLDACREAAREIEKACTLPLCVFGLPVKAGNRVFNALAIMAQGRITGFAVKQNLNSSQRQFFSTDCPETIDWYGTALPCANTASLPLPGSTASVRVWFYDDLLAASPEERGQQAAVLAVPALNPAVAGQEARLPNQLASLCAKGISLAYANAGTNESTTDLVYSGQAFITGSGGILAQALPFSQEAAFAEITEALTQAVPDASQAFLPGDTVMDAQMPYAPRDPAERVAWCRDCVEISARGLATRLQRIGAKAVTLGVSGGLDSAMALIIIRRAFEILDLDCRDIHAYSLPGLGSSVRTRRNALQLIESMGLPAREINLRASILQHFKDIGQDMDTHNTAYENSQARERTQVLMDLANKVGGLMVGTGDLSELSLGFATYGGDHLCMYGTNGGLYKSVIRLIIRQYALDAHSKVLKDTLLDILDTPISPELLPGKEGQISQHTEQILGPYLLNDFFLHHFLAGKAGPSDILHQTLVAFGEQFSKEEILSRLRSFFSRFFASQFKRSCMADGPMVLGVSLSPRGGFTLPSDASAGIWLSEIDRIGKKGSQQP